MINLTKSACMRSQNGLFMSKNSHSDRLRLKCVVCVEKLFVCFENVSFALKNGQLCQRMVICIEYNRNYH